MEPKETRLSYSSMKIIGLTGGIGSGKSKVLNEFKSFGVTCYEADKVAKKLMINDQDLINKIKSIFGSDVYHENELDSNKLANLVFNDKTKIGFTKCNSSFKSCFGLQNLYI